MPKIQIEISDKNMLKMKEWFESYGHTKYIVNDASVLFQIMIQHETDNGIDHEVDWTMALNCEMLCQQGVLTLIGPRTEGPDAHPDFVKGTTHEVDDFGDESHHSHLNGGDL